MMKTVTGGSDQQTELRRDAASSLAVTSLAAELLSERLCLAAVTSEPVHVDPEQLASAARLAVRLEEEVAAIVRTAHPDYAASLTECLDSARRRAERAWEEAQAYAAGAPDALCA